MWISNSQRRIGARGAASVEAVVVLPVFVILFVGLTFVRDLTGAKLAADEKARRCAWDYSANNCGVVPVGCEGVVAEASLGAIHPDIDAALEQGKAGLTGGSDGKGAVGRILQGFVLDALTQVFTKKLDAHKALERDRPGLFGGGKSQVTGNYRMACNLVTQTQEGVASAVWHQFVP